MTNNSTILKIAQNKKKLAINTYTYKDGWGVQVRLWLGSHGQVDTGNLCLNFNENYLDLIEKL